MHVVNMLCFARSMHIVSRSMGHWGFIMRLVETIDCLRVDIGSITLVDSVVQDEVCWDVGGS